VCPSEKTAGALPAETGEKMTLFEEAECMSAEKNGKKKPILRIVSLALVITLLCSVVATQFDEISRFVSVIAEDDPLSRIYSILQQGISEP